MIKDAYGNTRFFGTYRGVVVDTADPLNKSRVKLRIPQVLANEVTDWAWFVNTPGTNSVIPKTGDGVWVQFEGGDPSYPIWIGTFEPIASTLTAGTTGATGSTGQTGAGGYYGAWYDIQTQTITTPSVGQPVLIRKRDIENGFFVIDDSKITASNTGIYNLAFSFQLHNTGGGGSGSTVEIWLVKNGVAVPDSNTRVAVPTNNPYTVAAWNFFKDMSAGDNIQVYWATDNVHIVLQYNTGSMGGPVIPSSIITVNQVG